jgi:hypothetical protein
VVDSKQVYQNWGDTWLGTDSLYTKSTCAQTMHMDHVCPYLSMNKIIEQREMTKACEKEEL